MPASEINLDGSQLTQLAQRAVLLPLKPRSEAEAKAYPDTLKRLQAAAANDQHMVIAPTHLMVRGDKIIGYLSLNGLPVVQCWFDRQAGHASDSLKMIEHGETIFREQGVGAYAVACAPESPFTPHMERMGFTKLGSTVLWAKQI